MSYATLQTDIAGWMNRTDLTALIPSFITIAETRFQLDVRSWQMIVAASLTVLANDKGVAVPDDWLEWDALSISGRPLEYINADLMQAYVRQGYDSNYAAKYTMVGGALIVGGPAPNDVIVDTTYYGQIPTLAAAPGNTNWLLDTYPSLYLYGSLVGGFNYIGDDQNAAKYTSAYGDVLNDINSNARKAVTSGGQWRQRAR